MGGKRGGATHVRALSRHWKVEVHDSPIWHTVGKQATAADAQGLQLRPRAGAGPTVLCPVAGSQMFASQVDIPSLAGRNALHCPAMQRVDARPQRPAVHSLGVSRGSIASCICMPRSGSQ